MALQRAEKLPQIKIIYSSLKLCHNHPTWNLYPEASETYEIFLISAMSPKNERHFFQ